jgi:hypothetical protein
MAMKCPGCKAENAEGKNFCSDCGVLLTPQLIPLVRAQLEDYLKEHLRDQELVDVKTTEAIAERFIKWGKWFLIPATILITLLGVILGVVGIRDVSDVHKAAQQAITESNEATRKASDATVKGQEAEVKATVATEAIEEATARMKAEVVSAQNLSENVSGLERRTANQISDASKHFQKQSMKPSVGYVLLGRGCRQHKAVATRGFVCA